MVKKSVVKTYTGIREKNLINNNGKYMMYDKPLGMPIGLTTDVYSNEKGKPQQIHKSGLLGYTYDVNGEYGKNLNDSYGREVDNVKHYSTTNVKPTFSVNDYEGYGDYMSYIGEVYGTRETYAGHLAGLMGIRDGIENIAYDVFPNAEGKTFADTINEILQYTDIQYAMEGDKVGIVRNIDVAKALGGHITTNVNNYSDKDTRLGMISNQMYARALSYAAQFNSLRRTKYITPELEKVYGNNQTNVNKLSSLFLLPDGQSRIILPLTDGFIKEYTGETIDKYLINFIPEYNEMQQEVQEWNYHVKYFGFSKSIDNEGGISRRFNPNLLDEPKMVVSNMIEPSTAYRFYEEGDSSNGNAFDSTASTINTLDGFKGETIAIKREGKDILNTTNKLFKNRLFDTLVGRFHTSSDKENTLSQSAVHPIFGLSKGRNLLTKSAWEGGKGKNVNGYDNPYCRVWTYHNQYSKMTDLIRPFTDENGDFIGVGELQKDWNSFRNYKGHERLAKNSVLNKNGMVNITPTGKGFDGLDGEIDIKQCMFSIENLAWKDVNITGKGGYRFENGDFVMDYQNTLSEEQRGPNGGRIMWFPPYDIDFQETSSADWHEDVFIGRGEPIYTYTNTKRSGSLSFTLLIDHPSVLNYWMMDKKNTEDPVNGEQTLLRYFAGCEPIAPSEGANLAILRGEFLGGTKTIVDKAPDKKIIFDTYFPNNYSGVDVATKSEVIDTLFGGQYVNTGITPTGGTLESFGDEDEKLFLGYEMGLNPISATFFETHETATNVKKILVEVLNEKNALAKYGDMEFLEVADIKVELSDFWEKGSRYVKYNRKENISNEETYKNDEEIAKKDIENLESQLKTTTKEIEEMTEKLVGLKEGTVEYEMLFNDIVGKKEKKIKIETHIKVLEGYFDDIQKQKKENEDFRELCNNKFGETNVYGFIKTVPFYCVTKRGREKQWTSVEKTKEDAYATYLLYKVKKFNSIDEYFKNGLSEKVCSVYQDGGYDYYGVADVVKTKDAIYNEYNTFKDKREFSKSSWPFGVVEITRGEKTVNKYYYKNKKGNIKESDSREEQVKVLVNEGILTIFPNEEAFKKSGEICGCVDDSNEYIYYVPQKFERIDDAFKTIKNSLTKEEVTNAYKGHMYASPTEIQGDVDYWGVQYYCVYEEKVNDGVNDMLAGYYGSKQEYIINQETGGVLRGIKQLPYDIDGDGVIDYIYKDTNEDGRIDTREEYNENGDVVKIVKINYPSEEGVQGDFEINISIYDDEKLVETYSDTEDNNGVYRVYVDGKLTKRYTFNEYSEFVEIGERAEPYGTLCTLYKDDGNRIYIAEKPKSCICVENVGDNDLIRKYWDIDHDGKTDIIEVYKLIDENRCRLTNTNGLKLEIRSVGEGTNGSVFKNFEDSNGDGFFDILKYDNITYKETSDGTAEYQENGIIFSNIIQTETKFSCHIKNIIPDLEGDYLEQNGKKTFNGTYFNEKINGYIDRNGDIVIETIERNGVELLVNECVIFEDNRIVYFVKGPNDNVSLVKIEHEDNVDEVQMNGNAIEKIEMFKGDERKDVGTYCKTYVKVPYLYRTDGGEEDVFAYFNITSNEIVSGSLRDKDDNIIREFSFYEEVGEEYIKENKIFYLTPEKKVIKVEIYEDSTLKKKLRTYESTQNNGKLNELTVFDDDGATFQEYYGIEKGVNTVKASSILTYYGLGNENGKFNEVVRCYDFDKKEVKISTSFESSSNQVGEIECIDYYRCTPTSNEKISTVICKEQKENSIDEIKRNTLWSQNNSEKITHGEYKDVDTQVYRLRKYEDRDNDGYLDYRSDFDENNNPKKLVEGNRELRVTQKTIDLQLYPKLKDDMDRVYAFGFFGKTLDEIVSGDEDIMNFETIYGEITDFEGIDFGNIEVTDSLTQEMRTLSEEIKNHDYYKWIQSGEDINVIFNNKIEFLGFDKLVTSDFYSYIKKIRNNKAWIATANSNLKELFGDVSVLGGNLPNVTENDVNEGLNKIKTALERKNVLENEIYEIIRVDKKFGKTFDESFNINYTEGIVKKYAYGNIVTENNENGITQKINESVNHEVSYYADKTLKGYVYPHDERLKDIELTDAKNYVDFESFGLNSTYKKAKEINPDITCSFGEFYAANKDGEEGGIHTDFVLACEESVLRKMGVTEDDLKTEINEASDRIKDIARTLNSYKTNILSMTVKADASVEGNSDSNNTLAKNRAETLVGYLNGLDFGGASATTTTTQATEKEAPEGSIDISSLVSKKDRKSSTVIVIGNKPGENVLPAGSRTTNESPATVKEFMNGSTNYRRYDDERLFFSMLKEKDSFAYTNLVKKVQYFSPAFHSITPEGFNARLTFLQQCTRQGPTITASEVGTNGSTAANLAFGRAPFCVLRLGDFLNTKIVIRSVNITYPDNMWDLNHDGIGAQFMMAKVTMNIDILGGSDISAPIKRLQNAVSFNYYANTSIYDNRSDIAQYNSSGTSSDVRIWNPSLKPRQNGVVAQTNDGVEQPNS